MNWYKVRRLCELINYHPNGFFFLIFLYVASGKPMTKSIEMESHFQVGTSNGRNLPIGC